VGLSLINYLLGVGATHEAHVIWASAVNHGTTQIRSDWAASALEDCQPATDLAQWVVRGITDIQPEKLARIVVRIIIERSTGDVWADLLNALLVHIGVEDVRNFERRSVIVGVNFPSIAIGRLILDVGINLYPVVVAEHEARKLQINHVIVSSERTLDTERSDKLARGGIADVLTEISIIAEEVTACLRTGDQTENRNAIFLTKRIVSCTITDKLNTQNIKEILRELSGWGGDCGVGIAVIQSVRDGRAIDGSRRINSLSNITSNDLASNTEILRAAAVIQNSLSQLGELINSLANLTFNLEGSLQIVQADARGLVALGLQLPSANSLSERKVRRARNATSGVVGLSKTRRGRDVCPVVFKPTREHTLNCEFGESRTHAEGELAHTDEATPRAVNGVTLPDIDIETSGFALENVINCRTGNRSHDD